MFFEGLIHHELTDLWFLASANHSLSGPLASGAHEMLGCLQEQITSRSLYISGCGHLAWLLLGCVIVGLSSYIYLLVKLVIDQGFNVIFEPFLWT